MRKYRTDIPNEYNLNATRGCPCEGCPDMKGCKVECATYKLWVRQGAAKLERKARYHEKVDTA